jgi:phosphoglycolate phosphatase-like HAD superfamily hydrolase
MKVDFESKNIFIFDLDNTLIDEKTFLTTRLNIYLDSLGLSNLTEFILSDFEIYYELNGNHKVLDYLANKFGFNSNILVFRSLLETMMLEDSTILYDWVEPIMRQLVIMNKKIYICTNGRPEIQKIKCETLKFEFDPDIKLVCCLPGFKKPNPFHLLEICRQEREELSNVLFIGDSELDFSAANSANISFMYIDKFISEFFK